MEQELKDRWLEALESGDYQKGTGYLKYRAPNGHIEFCCLGVLADICGVEWEIDNNDVFRSELVTYATPDGSFMFYYGPNGELMNSYIDGDYGGASIADALTNINDGSETFGPVIVYIKEHV